MKKYVTHIYTWIVYAILWGMVWTYPILAERISAIHGDTAFSLAEVIHTWIWITPFFVLFLVHRIPLYRLLMLHRIKSYCLAVIILIALFGVWRYNMLSHDRPPLPNNLNGHPEVSLRHIHSDRPLDNLRAFPDKPSHAEMPRKHPKRRHTFLGIPGIVFIDLGIAILMLGFDIAIILLMRYQEDEKKQYRLAADNKERELELLKAQINPHFFMNMLNNIHSIAEIDVKEAQKMIMELSRMMRYVLYEGAKPLTTLQKEKEFIVNYVELMRKRCSSTKVHIHLDIPSENLSNIMIPPMLFISVIENAFKHGISYCRQSFVEIRISVINHFVILECLNSVHPDRSSTYNNTGGIGLVNMRKRLQLLFGNDFRLDLHHTADIYNLILSIPYKYETDKMHCN